MKNLEDSLHIQFIPLGTCAGNSTPLQDQSAYIVKIFNKNQENKLLILLDAGSPRVLSPKYLDHQNLRAICFSHLHNDHFRYFIPLIRILIRTRPNKPLFIIAHPKAILYIKVLLFFSFKGRIPRFLRLIGSYENQIKQIHLSNLSNTQENKQEGLFATIRLTSAQHSRWAVAFRITIQSTPLDHGKDTELADLVYSPDTAATSQNLVEFAKHAQFWCLDTTFNDQQMFAQLKTKPKQVGHSSPVYSAKLCQQAKVENYIAIHYFWSRFGQEYKTAKKNIKKRAQRFYKGNIIVSQDLRAIDLHEFDGKKKEKN